MDREDLEQFFKSTWQSTVEKSRRTLDQDDQDTIDDFKTWEALEKWVLNNAHPPITMTRPALGHLNVFVKFILTNLGPCVDTPFFWGSLACLLDIVSKNLKILDGVPRMIQSLVYKAGAVNTHLKSVQGSHNAVSENDINEVLFFIYLEFVDFFTSSIKYIHSPEANGEHKSVQQLIQQRYELATLELNEFLLRLKTLVTEAPIHHPENAASIRGSTAKEHAKEHCLMLPEIMISRVFDRLDVFVKLDELLAPDAVDQSLQSVALHGILGVGKTSVASAYAEKKWSEKAYNVVLWVHGETDASMRQDFTRIALRLRLPDAQEDTHDENRVLVQDWFQTTQCNWLVIFDNVDSSDVLAPYWPRSSHHGRAIITTRNFSLAFNPAAFGLEVQPWDTEMGAKYLLFLLKRAVGQDLASETASALTLSQKISGHALALSQMAGMIHEGEYSIREWTAMYLEDPKRAHVNEPFSRLWHFAFRILEEKDKNSFSLLGILAFLMPDMIQPEILQPKSDLELPQELGFFRDRFVGFSSALTKLITKALIKRDKSSGVITVHRLIQTQFRYYLSPAQRQEAFNNTVKLISSVLPETDSDKGQLYDTWESYNRYLQHVLQLRDIFEEERRASTSFMAPVKFCEILKDYQRFLYESFSFEECEKTCEINRDAASTLASDCDRINIEGSIISHHAQVLEKLGDPEKAAIFCQQEIDMRIRESPKKHILLAYSSCNLGIIYSSANDFAKSLCAFRESHKWWDAHCANKGEAQDIVPSISVSEARCMIGLGEFEKAEKILETAISKVKEERPLNFGTLAYAHFCFGVLYRTQHKYDSAEARFIEAQNAWLEGGQSRKHPFNAGILYNIGACCLDLGKTGASIKHLKDSLEVTMLYDRSLPVENGRNYFKLSEALKQNGDDSAADAVSTRCKAEAWLAERKSGLVENGTESSYSDLIPVYWR
ncbi:hypothetical protein ONS95_006358 [Cadophora gregata]|uniref:uncharacterized protein n=1 Tax=Cadophora gregata TaxID=51156 RepID=UPI0026DAAFDD|nr:uncharacterized protein ONS95_006358 [Cadophora gregata]KAK0102761.1 hypothetical protein ONS95_006358 [Cadophora gregata]